MRFLKNWWWITFLGHPVGPHFFTETVVNIRIALPSEVYYSITNAFKQSIAKIGLNQV